MEGQSQSRYRLGFISDEEIFRHVKATVEQYRRSINLRDFNSNIVDPIKLTFDAKVYRQTLQECVEAECMRQIDKSNNNTIGYFHQYLFRCIGNGWDVPKAGFDIQNDGKHIYVELKNKHNTMNSASAHRTYLKMQDQILKDDQAQCYLVEVISRKSQDEKWTITLNGQRFAHERIRRMSIDRFYALVFNQEDAFLKLCEALPIILDDVLESEPELQFTNTVIEELDRDNLFRGLYLSAFSTYQGFERF